MPYTIAAGLLKSLFDNAEVRIYLPKLADTPSLNIARGRFSVVAQGGGHATMTVHVERPPLSTGQMFLPRDAAYHVEQEMLDACEWDDTAKIFAANWTTLASRPTEFRE